jgi:hypothetical protein
LLNKISKLCLRIEIYASALTSWGWNGDFNNNEMLSTFNEEEESDFDIFFWIINIRDKVTFNKIKLGTSDSKYIKLKKKKTLHKNCKGRPYIAECSTGYKKCCGAVNKNITFSIYFLSPA